MKKVYVAGSYNGPNVIQVLDNMRIGMRASLDVLRAGFSPFCPWFDYHFQLMLRDGETLSIEDYYRYSMAWLEVSDVVYVCNYREDSNGTKAEIQRARELKIPVFFTFEAMIEHCISFPDSEVMP
jgi:hypothetical protein